MNELRHTAYITGGTGEIGMATAHALAGEGYNLFLQHRSGVAAEIRKNFPSHANQFIVPMQGDLSTDSFLKKMKRKDVTMIDTVIHTAAPALRLDSFEKITNTEFEYYFRVSVFSFTSLLKKIIPVMKERRYGRIIAVTSSVIHNVPGNKTSAYTSAKTALWGLCKSLAVELAPYNITVNTVSPGYTDTKFLDTFPPLFKSMILPKIPLRRFAQPEEVASLIAFLCSDQAKYITGIDIPIAGGLVM